MSTVIGLYTHDHGFSRIKRLLKLVGFKDDDIQLLNNEEVILGSLKTAQFDVVTKNACLDAIGLVALFSVVGQVANWFVFNMFDIGNTLLPDLDTT